MIKSQPINIIRYKNGTLIKLTPSAEGFMSYDYNVISGAATYAPEQIDIVAKAEGDLTVDKWEYSYDGETWYEVINGEDGIAINDNVLSIVPSSPLFSDTQSTVTFKCTGSDCEHYDTVMITRHVDPLYIYRTTNANIEQTNSKIRLIASDEQLNQFTVGKTMMSKVAEIEQTANGIKSTVETKYATKVYADESAGTAESNAKNYAKTYADSSAGAAETNAKAYADSTSEAAEQNAKDYADSSANTAESNAKSYAKSYADTASGTAEQNAKQYAATSASNAESRAKAYADTKETTLRSEISQTAEGIRSEVVMKDGFEEGVGSIIEQKADSIRMQASKIAWQAQNSSMTEDGTLTCQNAVIGGRIEVGKAQNVAGEMVLYDTNNIEQARLNATGMTFKPDGKTIYNGKIHSSVTGQYHNSQTVITDGQMFFNIDGTNISRWNLTKFANYMNTGLEANGMTWAADNGNVLTIGAREGNKVNSFVHFITPSMAAVAGLDFNTYFPHRVYFGKQLLAAPYKSAPQVSTGSACYTGETVKTEVTFFGPFVHFYFKCRIKITKKAFTEANKAYFKVFGSLPKPLDVPAATWPRVGMFIPCPAIGTIKVATAISYPFSLGFTSDGEIYLVTTNGYTDYNAIVDIDIRDVSGEFTYVIDPLKTKPVRPAGDGTMILR